MSQNVQQTNLGPAHVSQMKINVQDTIKRCIIDTKYTDEPITFGQAVVTYHYFNES